MKKKLLEKGETTGCGGLPDGHVGEQCWSICFDNDCNNAHFLALNFFAFISGGHKSRLLGSRWSEIV